ncbi:MAG: Adenine specific DNA methyltransferase [Parcubacteria group bacterium GW2011_GWB1_36_5]|nr:MAG: Adenine specific DNA methyltransferase [Parcubacteria group bacterium GW2011_GWB1_36_5]
MENYLQEIQKYFYDENSSEHSYRTSFENYLKEIFLKEKGYFTQQDQKAINGNKPDFIVLKNKVPLLYIEVKKVGEDLDKIEKSNQADRYFGYDNLIISDYINFRFFRNGQRYNEEISLGDIDKDQRYIKVKKENSEYFEKTILDFVSSNKEPIKHGKHLAQIMGGRAQRIRENVLDMLLSKSDRYIELLKIRDVVKQNLVSSLDDNSFSDMYAQTLVYGLFSARYNDNTLENFSRIEARELIPKTNPFLRSFFDHIAGNTFPDRLKYIVDELCEVFTHADVHKLMHEYFKKESLFGEVYESPDPVIHFYEDFLREYDAKKKMEMGVFYTPRPVVQFIVRAVDNILKNEFNLSKGLADKTKIQVERKETDKKGKVIKVQKEYHKVQILDVATGTGTFLNEVIKHIYKDFAGQEGNWPSYVENNLLPRLHGFELMMASYTIAHLKLGMTLQDTKAGELKTRLGIYLTNTLEEAKSSIWGDGSLFVGVQESITKEAIEASKVKSQYPIMCVIGNPPYSGISQNKIYTDNNVYKVEIGGKEKLKEKKNWLDDDYVKFIRFAESLIEKNGEGIMGMITAHGYIDNPTFRGMRWHLRNTFDKIYILDLHGNSNKGEISPDGSKDGNIFDIKTGVAIILGIKNSNTKNKKMAQVYKADFYGIRKEKFKNLDNSTIDKIDWVKLPENTDLWTLEGEGKNEYQKGFSVSELFPKNSTGIVTMGDSFIVDENKDTLTKRIDEFLQNDISESELKKKYNLGKNYAKWVINNKKKIDNDHLKVAPLTYRPFDKRYTYFDNNLVWRPRIEVMQHFVNKENVGLVFARSQKNPTWDALFITNDIPETKLGEASTQSAVAPLYLYTEQGEKIPNLNKEIWNKINKVVGETKPENILDYIYAFLHSPKYRETYKEFLKIDFPRVPYPTNKKEFEKLVNLGNKLRGLHLMTDPECENLITKYSVAGGNFVEKIKYENGNVYINSTQHFEGVPEISWNFYIGGYQPAQKYLKDRKGRQLNSDEIEHYQKIIKVLSETDKLMKEIDKK